MTALGINMTSRDLEYSSPKLTAKECWPARLINADEDCRSCQQDHAEAIDQYMDESSHWSNHDRVNQAYTALKAATDKFLSLYRQWLDDPQSFDDDPCRTDPIQTIDRR
jgi:hypothetical protein